MPVNYSFNIRRTQKPIDGEWYSHDGFEVENLNKVDKYICEWFGDEPDPKKYHRAYDFMVDAAITALMNLGGCGIERHHINHMKHWIDRLDKQTPHKDNLKGLVESLFGQKYFFIATRSFQ